MWPRNSDLGGVPRTAHQDLVVSLEVSYLHISEGQLGSTDTEVHLDGYVLPIRGLKVHYSFIDILILNWMLSFPLDLSQSIRSGSVIIDSKPRRSPLRGPLILTQMEFFPVSLERLSPSSEGEGGMILSFRILGEASPLSCTGNRGWIQLSRMLRDLVHILWEKRCFDCCVICLSWLTRQLNPDLVNHPC